MQNSILAEYAAHNRSIEIRKKETGNEKDLDRPDGFKAQIRAAAAKKDPKEMTLEEYREYIQEKIRKMFPFLPEYSLLLSVKFSDLALAEMKNDPDCEKMVLESMRFEVLREKSDAGAQLEFSIQRARERRKERKDQMMKILLRKKKMEIYYEKWALHREAYTEFLETGKRYVGPCPAAEFFALGQLGGGNIIF